MSTNKVLVASGAVLVLSILIELLFVHHHVHYWWHAFVGFDIIYGFLGCVAIIVVSKFLGKAFIQKKEDYYGGGEDNES